MRTLILLVCFIVAFAFTLFAAYRLNVLSEQGKVDSSPFKRLTALCGVSWAAVFVLMFTIVPSMEI